MPIEPVEMTPSDCDEVLNFWENMVGVGLNESDTPPLLSAYLRRNPGLSFVARHEGRIVGAVLCGHDGRRGYLHHLAVVPEHRQQGLGKALVERCLSRLGSLGTPKCNIFVYDDNDDGSEFWRHNGWLDRDDLKMMQHPISRQQAADELQGCPAKMVQLVAEREPLDVLFATPATLRQIVEEHSLSKLRFRPYAEKWTPTEILGHLVDNEIVAGFRFRSVLYGHEPIIEGYPQEQWVAGQRHNDGDPAEFVKAFEVLRECHLRVWSGLDDTALKKVGHRADRGPETVALMLTTLAGHDLSHIDQIERYLAATRKLKSNDT